MFVRESYGLRTSDLRSYMATKANRVEAAARWSALTQAEREVSQITRFTLP